MFNQKKIQQLEERIADLEKGRDSLSWASFPMNAGSSFGIPHFCLSNRLTGREILTRFDEIYDYLGATRETSPEVTKLKKKNAP